MKNVKYFHYSILNQFESVYSKATLEKLISRGTKLSLVAIIIDFVFVAIFALISKQCCINVNQEHNISYFIIFIFSSMIILLSFRINVNHRGVSERKIAIAIIMLVFERVKSNIYHHLTDISVQYDDQIDMEISSLISKRLEEIEYDLSSLELSELNKLLSYEKFNWSYLRFVPRYILLQLKVRHLLIPLGFLVIRTFNDIYPVATLYASSALSAYVIFVLFDFINFNQFANFVEKSIIHGRPTIHYLFNLKYPMNRKGSVIASHLLNNY